MIIIGVDYHPSFQLIAFLDQETGECGERELNHSDGEAEKFLSELIVELESLLLIFPVAKQLLKASVHLSRDFVL